MNVKTLMTEGLKEERGGCGGLCRRVTLGHICFNASYVIDKVSLIRWKNTAERLIYDSYRH